MRLYSPLGLALEVHSIASISSRWFSSSLSSPRQTMYNFIDGLTGSNLMYVVRSAVCCRRHEDQGGRSIRSHPTSINGRTDGDGRIYLHLQVVADLSLRRRSLYLSLSRSRPCLTLLLSSKGS